MPPRFDVDKFLSTRGSLTITRGEGRMTTRVDEQRPVKAELGLSINSVRIESGSNAVPRPADPDFRRVLNVIRCGRSPTKTIPASAPCPTVLSNVQGSFVLIDMPYSVALGRGIPALAFPSYSSSSSNAFTRA